MATVTAKRRDLIEDGAPGIPLVYAGATGGGILVGEEGFEAFCRNLFPTGAARRSLQQALGDTPLDIEMATKSPGDVNRLGITLFVSLKDVTQVQTEPFEYSQSGSKIKILKGTDVEDTIGSSPLIQRQVELVLAGLGAKLQARLSQYWNDCPGQARVTASTKDAVSELVAWLSGQAEAVSATVSDDGTLSIASIFPNDVRFYVEIDRDGSTEAAVTRQRRYALDIAGNTVADFSPEVILAAVENV